MRSRFLSALCSAKLFQNCSDQPCLLGRLCWSWSCRVRGCPSGWLWCFSKHSVFFLNRENPLPCEGVAFFDKVSSRCSCLSFVFGASSDQGKYCLLGASDSEASSQIGDERKKECAMKPPWESEILERMGLVQATDGLLHSLLHPRHSAET